MGIGFLEITVTTEGGARPVAGAGIIVLGGDTVLYELITDEGGITETVALEAPEKELALDAAFEGVPYSVADVKIEAEGFTPVIVRGVQIFDMETSILPVHMEPRREEGRVIELEIPEHSLAAREGRGVDVPKESPEAQGEVVIPKFITTGDIPFLDYIKNSVSNEVYPNWPPAALEANIYCVISLALNRVYMRYVPGGQVFQNIGQMVDQIFSRYIRREGRLEPFFAEFCDGRRRTCAGLWQWGTVTLAEQGLNALQILRHYYPGDVQIIETDDIEGAEPFPGFELRPGMSGDAVKSVQVWLNRIGAGEIIERNGDSDSAVRPLAESGFFCPQTEAAVRAFQSARMFETAPSGTIDRATWYRISFAHSAVTSCDDDVRQIQLCLNKATDAGLVPDGVFGPRTRAAVIYYQRANGLYPDGIAGEITLTHLGIAP